MFGYLISEFTYQESPHCWAVQFWAAMIKWGHGHCRNKDWNIKFLLQRFLFTKNLISTYLERKYFPASSLVCLWVQGVKVVIYLYQVWCLFWFARRGKWCGNNGAEVTRRQAKAMNENIFALFIRRTIFREKK